MRFPDDDREEKVREMIEDPIMRKTMEDLIDLFIDDAKHDWIVEFMKNYKKEFFSGYFRDNRLPGPGNLNEILPALNELGPFLMDSMEIALGPHYTDIKPFRAGKTRVCFTALYGGQEVRVIKVDRKDTESQNALINMIKGYGNRNEKDILLGLDHPNITNLLHYEEIGNRIVTVEPFFDGETLEEYVDREGPLDFFECMGIFSKIIKGDEYLINRGLFHRDIKPSNILVGEDEYTFETLVKLTDLANASRIDSVQPGFAPTMGSHLTADPLLLYPGDEEALYTEQSEMYSIGATLFFALTGQYAFELDPSVDIGFCRTNLEEGTSMQVLDDNLCLDKELYETALRASISKNIPFEWQQPIERCMTLKTSRRSFLNPRISAGGRYGSIYDLSIAAKANPIGGLITKVTSYALIGAGLIWLAKSCMGCMK